MLINDAAISAVNRINSMIVDWLSVCTGHDADADRHIDPVLGQSLSAVTGNYSCKSMVCMRNPLRILHNVHYATLIFDNDYDADCDEGDRLQQTATPPPFPAKGVPRDRDPACILWGALNRGPENPGIFATTLKNGLAV